MPDFQTVATAVHWLLLLISAACILRACMILIFRVPAKADLVHDGYDRARRERNAAVFIHERAPMPHTVEDTVAFTTRDGQEIRAEVRRPAVAHDRSLLVWYSPNNPSRVSTTGPLAWGGWSLASLGTAACFFWL